MLVRNGRLQPAFYGRTGSQWGDILTLLHPPYTAWHLSYVVYGASVASELDVLRLSRGCPQEKHRNQETKRHRASHLSCLQGRA